MYWRAEEETAVVISKVRDGGEKKMVGRCKAGGDSDWKRDDGVMSRSRRPLEKRRTL